MSDHGCWRAGSFHRKSAFPLGPNRWGTPYRVARGGGVAGARRRTDPSIAAARSRALLTSAKAPSALGTRNGSDTTSAAYLGTAQSGLAALDSAVGTRIPAIRDWERCVRYNEVATMARFVRGMTSSPTSATSVEVLDCTTQLIDAYFPVVLFEHHDGVATEVVVSLQEDREDTV